MTTFKYPREPIAIVGSACRFAGDATSPSKLWELLKNPRDVQTEIPSSRFSAHGYYHPDSAHHGHSNILHSYLLQDDIRTFDAEFFNINPVEAKAMDPQQRVLMETVYEAIEAAGLTIEGLKGSDTGVFAGVMTGDYEAMLLRDLDAAPTYFAVGTSRAILSNRIAYFFDWHGAAITIDTACSSSLVAVHNAMQTLRDGDSQMAVACGSNLILGPESYIIESKLKMLSPDGRSRMWDKDANGYARGDGVAAIVLKRLSTALADGDHIECIIRETGINQDGATPGLTMPSASAQQTLIRRTYEKAGLDLANTNDRPQYFEAHGTGTPAGDPVEAEAISASFFGGSEQKAAGSPLYVGSIKTVLGHTEGTAGIAAIMKASLAIQDSTIPPNLLFSNLNPNIEPYYDDLEIRTTAIPWPDLTQDQVKRVSVNSFGFGGTNAHAIIENFGNPARVKDSDELYGPFVFSATSATSLRASLSAYAEFLENRPDISIRDLAYTLRDRRTKFPVRASFSTSSATELRANILTRLENDDNVGVKIPRSNGVATQILGVFTGQGAQTARMGAALIEGSALAAQIIDALENALSELPPADRPAWSLREEILAEKTLTRVNEATISQPLCTAIQIMLVDLLNQAGVRFSAVVGHSSGEIAAAYAAGFLTARDAIVIAYYRGLHCKSSASPNKDIPGAMLAVGTTIEDAKELCEMDEFAGRLSLAASNSSSSVTISGDSDAISELQVILDDEKKFNRRLKVDQAYHSPHMRPCYDPYVASLCCAGVNALRPTHLQCAWFSSVLDGMKIDPSVPLDNTYWAENMTKPVLFAQALTAALSAGIVYDAALEIGSHPALKGPASQTIAEASHSPMPYSATLTRDMSAKEALSTALGFLWIHSNDDSISLTQLENKLNASDGQCFNVLKGLPTYRWNHEVQHWHESRRSRRMRLRQGPFHPLLGNRSPDSAPHHLKWKNILKPRELSWLTGHQVQGQIVFPAAGYVSTAIEGALFLNQGREICLIELSDFNINQAVMFDEEESAIEVLIELSQITEAETDQIKAKFTYTAALGDAQAELTLAAQGQIRVTLGEPNSSLLLKKLDAPVHMINVETNRLYNFMESLEYNFTGSFRSLDQLRRKLGYARCAVDQAVTADADQLLLHPVNLDAGFQSVMLAYSYPGDEQLRDLHLPTSITRVCVNPVALRSQAKPGKMGADSTCLAVDRSIPGAGFCGDVALYLGEDQHAAVQVDQVVFKPLKSTAAADRNMFSEMEWVPNLPDGTLAANGIPVTQHDTDLLWVLSRIASYFLRKFDEDVPEDSAARSESPLCHYLHYAKHMTRLLRTGEHKYAKMEWVNDELEDVLQEVKAKGVQHNSDVQIMLLVGETMPRVFRGETTMLEHMRESGLLDAYYAHGFGTMQSSLWLGNITKQMTARDPHLNILEIGAGTGGATKNILHAIGHDLDSYTFTDISSSFFENAADIFAPWRDRMVFKVCDAEKDPLLQGFSEGAYDVVIGSLVVHATAELDKTMRNLRKLLKPGGFLVIGEGSSDGPLQSGDGFIFGALPGWWLGVDEGRNLSPFINVPQWDAILKRTGFSGIDTISPPEFLDTFGVILFVSQAIDDRCKFVREPRAMPHVGSSLEKLAIIGGATETVGTAVSKIKTSLQGITDELVHFKKLDEVDIELIESNTTVLCLSDLECPVFENLSDASWVKFKHLFATERTVMFLTSGRIDKQPFSNMLVGFGRSAAHEVDGLRLQFLDIPDVNLLDATMVVETLMRFHTKHLENHDILYTAEPEVIVDSTGRQLVPRLKSVVSANNRYNSVSRQIEKLTDLTTSVVEFCQRFDHFSLREVSRFEQMSESTSDRLKLTITHSILSSVKTVSGHLFLALGTDGTQQYLTMTSVLRSTLFVSRNHLIPVTVTEIFIPAYLRHAAIHLVCLLLIDPLNQGEKLIVHNPTAEIAEAIASHSTAKGIRTVVATDFADKDPSMSSCVTLSRYTGRTELSKVITADLACFASLSAERPASDNILSHLMPGCRQESVDSIFYGTDSDVRPSPTSSVEGLLLRISSMPQDESLCERINVMRLNSLPTNVKPKDPLTILDWTDHESLRTRVTRLDTRDMFKGDKTYWLCGMSGALGISLCDWMIERGVKHLVLTSRNPKVEPAWIETHRKNGVNVVLMSCDVTNEEDLKRVHETIVESLPPIAGALNGVMVLRDSSIQNMSFQQVLDVIHPKVLGSIHLDRIFHDVDLDFFILLSSLNCIIGNVGQANYAAAKWAYRQLDATVAKMAMMHLSEEDFHQIFAEGMEGGYPDSGLSAELSTGIRDIAPDSGDIPKWYSDPKFGRFILHRKIGDDDRKQQGNTTSIKDRLLTCKARLDVQQVVRQAFATQLRKILQSSLADEEILVAHTNELGLDSLISVDIRTWFLKNFRVNIPVLKIMASDVQMASLADLAVESIPQELVPLVENVETPLAMSAASSALSSAVGSRLETPDGDSSASSATDNDTSPPRTGTHTDKIDWKLETILPDPITMFSHLVPNDRPPKVVVLTGVSGLLGHHLLAALLAQSSISKIICVAVRNLAARIKNEDIPEPSERLQYYAEDLTLPRLGLSTIDASHIFAEADAVIHNASDTSHLKYYSALKDANVGSTRQLLDYCIPRMIPFHYVSSAGIALFAGGGAFPEVSATSTGLLPPSDGAHGYMCGKWVNEVLLEKVNATYGLRVCIQRPSTIIREGDDATTTKADFDWVNALIHYSHKTEAVPEVKHSRGAFDLVYVRSVCDDIVRELLTVDANYPSRITYMNNVGDVIIPMDRMTDLGKSKNKLYKSLPMEEWCSTAIAAGLHPAVAALIETFDEPGSPAYPALLKDR
ncbi:putative polyketide synthase, partial [Aureobasidium melanogenum]